MLNGPLAGMVRTTTCSPSRHIATLTIIVGGVIIALFSATTPVRGFIAAPKVVPTAAARTSGCHWFAPTPDLGNNAVLRAGIFSSLLHMDTQQPQGTKCRRRSTTLSVVSRRALSETEAVGGKKTSPPPIPAPVTRVTAGNPPSSSNNPDIPTPAKLVYNETAQRSFAKALVWRFIAAVVTLMSSLTFSGSVATAMGIVVSDFLTKSLTMFAGERLWNNVKWGQGKTGDSAKRSLAKAVLWRLFAASNTLICGIFLAKDLSVASKIAGSDTVFKTALFFVNERLWASVGWGKTYEPEYFI